FEDAANDRGSLPDRALRVRCSCEEPGSLAQDVNHAIDLRGCVVEIETGTGCSGQAEPAHERLVAMMSAAQGEAALIGERGEVVRMYSFHDETEDGAAFARRSEDSHAGKIDETVDRVIR